MAEVGPAKTHDLDAMSNAVIERFDDVPWNLFNSSDKGSRDETRFMVLRARDDLLKVAELDAPRAARIWDEHVPTYVPRPAALPVLDAELDLEPTNAIEPGRKRRRAKPEAFLDVADPAPTGLGRSLLDVSAPKPDPAGPEGAAPKPDPKPEARPAQAQAEDRSAPDDRKEERIRLLLEGIAKQYVQAEGKYHFRDRSREVAFEDRAKKLVTAFDNPSVVSSMIDLAETKGWSSLKLSGTDDFRREAWLQASLRDFEVSGYRPTKLDQARLAELRAEVAGPAENIMAKRDLGAAPEEKVRAGFSSIPEEGRPEPAVPLTAIQDKVVKTLEAAMRRRGDSEEAIAKAHDVAIERLTSSRVHVGVLVGVGTAPYQDRNGEKESHYVTLRDDKGRTSKVWGVDLPRALEASDAQIDDLVAVAYRGRKPVTVDLSIKDESGQTVGTKRGTVDRNTWEVVQFDRLRSDTKASVLKAAAQQETSGNIKVFDRTAKSVTPPIDRRTERSRTRERTL